MQVPTDTALSADPDPASPPGTARTLQSTGQTHSTFSKPSSTSSDSRQTKKPRIADVSACWTFSATSLPLHQLPLGMDAAFSRALLSDVTRDHYTRPFFLGLHAQTVDPDGWVPSSPSLPAAGTATTPTQAHTWTHLHLTHLHLFQSQDLCTLWARTGQGGSLSPWLLVASTATADNTTQFWLDLRSVDPPIQLAALPGLDAWLDADSDSQDSDTPTPPVTQACDFCSHIFLLRAMHHSSCDCNMGHHWPCPPCAAKPCKGPYTLSTLTVARHVAGHLPTSRHTQPMTWTWHPASLHATRQRSLTTTGHRWQHLNSLFSALLRDSETSLFYGGLSRV